MLDSVGDINLVERELGLSQGGIEDPAGRTHEGMALQVLLVTRLLADEHEPGVQGALAEYDLGGPGPEVASPALSRS
jgi:hypothetical protein